MGEIGSRSAHLYRAFGCEILALDGHRVADTSIDFIKFVSEEDFYKNSDIIVLHVPA